jgi:hypothetical protein
MRSLPVRRRLHERVAGFRQKLNAAANQYAESQLTICLRLIAIYVRRGFRPVDALTLGLADPKITRDVLRNCIKKSELLAIQEKLNPKELISLTEDKNVFAAYCAARSIPAPAHFATLGRETSRRPGEPALTNRDEWLSDVVPRLPPSFITKPALGVYGEGVTLWVREDGGFRDHARRLFSAEALYELCCADAKYDRYVVQQRLANHPSIVALTGASTLQTVRVATFVDANGEAKCLYAEWKLAMGNNITDNLSSGRSANWSASVALADGAVGLAQAPEPHGVGFRSVRHHPVTGALLEGYRLPDWSAALDLARRSARLFLPVRTIGWDIGLTPQGPVILEGNRWWDPPTEAMAGPLAPGLARHELISNGSMLKVAAAMRRG